MALSPVPDITEEAFERPSVVLHSGIPNPAQNEELLLQLVDAITDASSEFEEICSKVAATEADWKYEYSMALLGQRNIKGALELKQAAAQVAAADAFRAWCTYKELQKGKASHLRSLERALDARRTVAANHRTVVPNEGGTW